jgi:hypothetical protein
MIGFFPIGHSQVSSCQPFERILSLLYALFGIIRIFKRQLHFILCNPSFLHPFFSVAIKYNRFHNIKFNTEIKSCQKYEVGRTFSTQVQVHFTLPKLVVLRVGTLLLLVLGLIRIKKGLVHPLPRTLLWSSLALAAWWILSTFFAIQKSWR